MLVVVAYDVRTDSPEGRGRLARVAKACENWGQRVQNSVFECLVDPAQWAMLKGELLDRIDPKEDSLRFYYLGRNWQRRVEHVGAKATVNLQGPLVI